MSGGPEGTLFVVSAPSGTGKSTLARRLVRRVDGLSFSVSYTTRERRAGEVEGRDYHFIAAADFRAMAAAGAFLEWARVFGHEYGTAAAETHAALAAGQDLLLDIDVQGAAQVRARHPEAVSIFILPPDYASLGARLRARGREIEAEIARRLQVSAREVVEFPNYGYLVVNDDVERALDELRAIVLAERARSLRRLGMARRIAATFPPPGEDPP